MTIPEFIDERFPIDDLIKEMKSSPIQRILDNDDLPCDDVRFIDGALQKVVEVSADVYVPVTEILSYCKEDVDKMNDVDFKTAYTAYMGLIDVTDVCIESIMSAVREYKANVSKKEGLLGKCTQ